MCWNGLAFKQWFVQLVYLLHPVALVLRRAVFMPFHFWSSSCLLLENHLGCDGMLVCLDIDVFEWLRNLAIFGHIIQVCTPGVTQNV